MNEKTLFESLVKASKSLSWLRKAQNTQRGKLRNVEKIIFLTQGEKLSSKELKSIPREPEKKIQDKTGSVGFWQNHRESVWLIQTNQIQSNQGEKAQGEKQTREKKINSPLKNQTEQKQKKQSHYGLFDPSPYSMARDLSGACLIQILKKEVSSEVSSIEVEYRGKDPDEFKGLCVGLDMAQYQFKKCWPKEKKSKIKINFKSSFKNQEDLIESACNLSEAVNLARFLVDCPANLLGPKNYVHLLKSYFGSFKKCKIQIWDSNKLEKEKMGLHRAVGQGSKEGSHLVHLSYHGAKNPNTKKIKNKSTQKQDSPGAKEKFPSFAFVGKGITFDSGGLNIKHSTGMRLMKKDMGGSACLAGLASFLIQSQKPLNADFYFAIAENSVSAESFRPGDILISRSGQTVEVDNTDAEGRLVMADALSLAIEKKPSLLIDVATLTGAIKYGLGLSTAGLFSNDDSLADGLVRSSQIMGETCWRMPLVPQEAQRLKSNVADTLNSTVDGFGGAITAALFLEKFVKSTPWVHFDIYSWTNRATTAFSTSGGTGQMVQTLSHFFSTDPVRQGLIK